MSKKSITFSSRKSVKVKKFKIDVGQSVCFGSVLFVYEDPDSGKLIKVKSKYVGTVVKLALKEGEILNPGDEVLIIEESCSHPTVVNDLCAVCGADLQKESMSESNATVPMIHALPQLKISQQEAEMIGKADKDRLLSDRKLALLVDLDQTLIHTTHDNIPNNIKDVHHFQLGSSSWYHTRLRPSTAHFLQEMSSYFELHICTFGVRSYAHMVASILDEDHSLFSNRILSREEFFNSNSKFANLQALFPNGDDLVCIIDDRKDVWNNSRNLVPVKPYVFFTNTGDINDPNLPPVTKHSDFFAKGVTVKKKSGEAGEEKTEETDRDLLDVEDEDDYLLYLESILKKVHELFYQVYDKKVEGIPHVRWVLDHLRGSVLNGCEIVFSGLVPLHEGLENSEPYLIATDLGAAIAKTVSERTTHIVAARAGTSKVHESKKFPNIKIVNPQWLTECLYRWERVDERLFPLLKAREEKSAALPLLLISDNRTLIPEMQSEISTDSNDTAFPNHIVNNSSENHVMPINLQDFKSLPETVMETVQQNNCEQNVITSLRIPSTNVSDLIKHTEKRLPTEKVEPEKPSTSADSIKNIDSLISIFKKEPKKVPDLPPAFLDLLKYKSANSESLKKYQIPKKVRIEEVPEVRIIDNNEQQNPQMSSLKKRKRKSGKPLASTSSTSNDFDNVDYVKRNKQIMMMKLKQLENSQRILEDDHSAQRKKNQDEFLLKMEQCQEEHSVRMKRLRDDIQHMSERHNLNMQNLYSDHQERISQNHLEHSLRIKLMNEEHEMKMKHLVTEHRERMKSILMKRNYNSVESDSED